MQRDHHGRRSKAWESTIRKAHLQLRSCTIFSAMSVLPYDDDPSAAHHRAPPPPPDLHHVERLLPNGDFFTGLASASSGRPHGAGKYLWTDGCVYDGDWADGAPHGRGRFSWPSGATYEGEFASWLLEGSGTFTGASGDTYRGTFRSNLKHGRGRRTYPNGDYYDGEWRGGVQEGAGRYVWKSGHEYNGSWRDGRMGGKGVVFWADGSSYDGEWDEGVPGGKGQFRWPDGGVFLGIWGKDRRTGRAPILVSAAPENVRREPEEELEAALRDCEVCRGETVMLFPSQKVVHWSGKHVLEKLVSTDLPRLRRGSADTSQAPRRGGTNGGHGNGSRRRWESYGDVSCCNTDDSSGDGAGQAPATPRTPARWQLGGEGKKPGETISRGHKNYELMLNLQIGIRHAVGRTPQATSLDLKPSAFDPKDKIWTRFPPEGSKHTPPHQSCDFRWKDYCPGAFRTLRKLFNVDAADYMLSICGNDALRELSSPGKSGSFFYLSQDDRYMIKTVKKAEAKVLLKMLPAYYNHVKSHKNTLLTRFYGLHCVKLSGATQKKVRFVIMGNLFYMDYPIHRRFDLKGSSHGRITDKPESEIDETTTLKDLDLNFIFKLQKSWYHDFIWQLEQDSQFLENEKIMDYSLLVGVHFKGASSLASNTDGSVLTRSCSSGIPQPFRGDLAVCQNNLYDRCTPARLGISVPSEVELTGEQTGEYYDAFLFFGIIDILQDYDLTKKLEHAYKSMHHDPASISSVDPRQYSKRFRDFIIRVFKEAH